MRKDRRIQGCPMTALNLQWTRDLALLINDLDEDHRGLLDKLNALLMAIASRNPTRVLMAFGTLNVEAEAHFACEEVLMRDVAYPGRERHCEEHQRLLRGLSELRCTIGAVDTFSASMGPFVFLERWFVPHLRHDDKELADFLADRVPACATEVC
jgi:hemerythrin-like metal-binding protein